MKKLSIDKVVRAYNALEEAKKLVRYLSPYRESQSYRYADAMRTKSEKEEEFSAACESVTAAISAAEGRARVRTISAADICKALVAVEDKLGIPKRSLDGVEVEIDVNAQSFPSAYKGTPESTHFTAVNRSGKWTLTDIYRAPCSAPSKSAHVNLSDEARSAILDRMSSFAL